MTGAVGAQILPSLIQRGTNIPDPITAITAEEIDQATRQRFVNAPAAVIADAKRAKDTTIALESDSKRIECFQVLANLRVRS